MGRKNTISKPIERIAPAVIEQIRGLMTKFTKSQRMLAEYIVQRPESHSIHHGISIHKYNYSDLPLVDIIFGTFRNPTQEEVPQTGFYKGASKRVVDMLLCKDVSQPVAN